MKDKLDQSMMDKIVSAANKRKNIFGAVFYISTEDNSIDSLSASGNLEPVSQYYIASINKLFISAILLKLYADNQLSVNDKISAYIQEEVMRGLHIHNRKDYSNDLTIAHLLSHTSGLPCYLTDTQADGKNLMSELEAGIDQPWPIDKIIQTVKRMKTHFPPGEEGKAKYVDTNYQILGLVIEYITGMPVQIALKNLFQELNLARTYVVEDIRDDSFAPIYYKTEQRRVPLFLNSTHNDIISTAKDQMTFLKAFFNGHFFPKERLHELGKWNNVFFPFRYGIGIQKFYMPRILSPFQPVPEMIGHAGSTGSVAFYVPEKDVYITGTINQQAQPNIAFQTMIRILMRVKSRN
ncbi:MAG: beta-lactamase family protein [Anaerolineales bacterium]|nr:beta-lactamase family protein [Anaerolineales bacterium]